MGDTLRFRTDPAFTGPVVVFAGFAADSNAGAVRVEPGDDVRALIPRLAQLQLIEIAFPKYRDGRGYSSARILREAGFAGEIRAAGAVFVDQLEFMRRAGFDSFTSDTPLDAAVVERTLARYPYVYQKAADAAVPVWALRHG